MPRPRVRDGSIIGMKSATPRMTFTGPIIKDRLAVTESLEYRFVRTPVNSETLPPLQRDMKLEGFNSFSQYDLTISPKQTATISLAVYPQKLDFLGLNTFTPQPSTGDFHQRGYQLYGQDHYLLGPDSVLTSQLSFKRYDVDVTAQNNEPFQLLVDTTAGRVLQPPVPTSHSIRRARDLSDGSQALPWFSSDKAWGGILPLDI